MSSRIPRESARFAILSMRFDADADALVVDIESDHLDRNFRVEWSPERAESMAVVCHWGSDCVESTAELSPNTAWDLERFCDSSDAIAEAFEDLRWESMVSSKPRKAAGGGL